MEREEGILCKGRTAVYTAKVNVGSSPAINTKNIKNNENYLEISNIFVIFVLWKFFEFFETLIKRMQECQNGGMVDTLDLINLSA